MYLLCACSAEKLSQAVPGISSSDLSAMQRCPMRSYDPALRDEPLVYRLDEAVMHYGEALKHIINGKTIFDVLIMMYSGGLHMYLADGLQTVIS
jgi:cyanate lyase